MTLDVNPGIDSVGDFVGSDAIEVVDFRIVCGLSVFLRDGTDGMEINDDD